MNCLFFYVIALHCFRKVVLVQVIDHFAVFHFHLFKWFYSLLSFMEWFNLGHWIHAWNLKEICFCLYDLFFNLNGLVEGELVEFENESVRVSIEEDLSLSVIVFFIKMRKVLLVFLNKFYNLPTGKVCLRVKIVQVKISDIQGLDFFLLLWWWLCLKLIGFLEVTAEVDLPQNWMLF